MSKKFYWLKLKDDFFETEEIKLIENMENGKDYIIFLLKLRLKSINSDGLLNFKGIMPYNEKMLSTITNTNIDIVKSALEILQKLKLITIFDDGTIYMEQIKELIGSETHWATKKRQYREKLKDKEDNVLGLSSTCPSHVRQEKEIEIEKDIDKELDIEIDKDFKNLDQDNLKEIKDILKNKYRMED